jgi:hypothetical protein
MYVVLSICTAQANSVLDWFIISFYLIYNICNRDKIALPGGASRILGQTSDVCETWEEVCIPDARVGIL